MPIFTRLKNYWLRFSFKKRFVFACIAVLVAIFIFSQQNSQGDLLTKEVERGTVIETVVSGGNLSAGGEAPIYSSTTGIISEIYVDNNERVKRGQKLFRVKSTASIQEKSAAFAAYQAALTGSNTSQQGKLTLQAQLEEARQDVLSASVNVTVMNDRVANSKTNPTTGKEYTQEDKDILLSALASSKQTFSAVEKKYKEVDQSISSSKSQITAAWDAYQSTIDTDTIAPSDGEIVNLLALDGDRVNAFSMLSATTTPVLYLIGTDAYAIKTELNEFDVYKVKAGQEASIVFDTFPDITFKGTVGKIDTIGSKQNSTVTYDALIALDKKDGRIKPGMTAKVSIVTNQKNDVLAIPNSALRKEENKTVVNVIRDGKISAKQVRLGLRGDTSSEVLEGLTEGDTIVLSAL